MVIIVGVFADLTDPHVAELDGIIAILQTDRATFRVLLWVGFVVVASKNLHFRSPHEKDPAVST